MGRKQPQLKKVVDRNCEVKQGHGNSSTVERFQETATGVWGKDGGVTAVLGQVRTLSSTSKADILRRAEGDTEGWQPQHNLLKD